jgi:hypothetical protein
MSATFEGVHGVDCRKADTGICECGAENEPIAEVMRAAADKCAKDRVLLEAGAEEIDRLRQRVDVLRRTLEQTTVRLMGPRSPYWQCPYCQASHMSPIAFKHEPTCLMASEAAQS